VGRAEELRELHGLLQGGERVAIAAATGMGGIGKTELAWQYCQARRRDYAGGIWWLTVREGSLASQVLGLAVRMGLGQPPEQLEAEAAKVQWCFDRWGQVVDGDRLLVLDDVVAYGPLRELLPQDERFKVLLTTRRKILLPSQRLDLGVLSEGEALELLFALWRPLSPGPLPPSLGEGEFEAKAAGELEEARGLCEWLGYLPLGIELVGRYLARKPGLAVATLLGRLEEKRLAALAVRKVPEEMPYQLNLAAAFELSWLELDEDGQQLGCFLSLFALAPIPWELVEACVPEEEREALEDCRDEQLLRQSLLEFVEAGRYQLHQVIRENFAAKSAGREDAEALQTAFATVLARVAAQVPQIATLAVQEQMREVVPHLEEVAQKWTAQIEDDDCGWPFTALARLCEAQSLWESAEAHLQDRLQMTEHRMGLDHPHTATSLDNLALLYQSMGFYGEAEPLCARSLKIREERLGPDHPDTATSLSNIALLYQAMGRYEEAEPLHVRSLKIREERLGPDHPGTATSLNNLAVLHQLMGRYEEAELLYVHALKISAEQLGPEHPDMAQSLNNLATLYQLMGRYEEAELLYARSLKINEEQLGPEHPDTAQSLNNLAELYRLVGRYGEAEPLYARSLKINEEQLGSDHPDTATSLNNLALLYQAMGRYGEADLLFVRSIKISKAKRGSEHPNTVASLSNLALLFYRQNRFGESERLLHQILTILDRKLGASHPSTKGTFGNLNRLITAAVQCGATGELSNHPTTQNLLQQIQEQDNSRPRLS